MEPRRRNPLRRYPTAVCISVLHFGLTQSKTRALNSPGRHERPEAGNYDGRMPNSVHQRGSSRDRA